MVTINRNTLFLLPIGTTVTPAGDPLASPGRTSRTVLAENLHDESGNLGPAGTASSAAAVTLVRGAYARLMEDCPLSTGSVLPSGATVFVEAGQTVEIAEKQGPVSSVKASLQGPKLGPILGGLGAIVLIVVVAASGE